MACLSPRLVATSLSLTDKTESAKGSSLRSAHEWTVQRTAAAAAASSLSPPSSSSSLRAEDKGPMDDTTAREMMCEEQQGIEMVDLSTTPERAEKAGGMERGSALSTRSPRSLSKAGSGSLSETAVPDWRARSVRKKMERAEERGGAVGGDARRMAALVHRDAVESMWW